MPGSTPLQPSEPSISSGEHTDNRKPESGYSTFIALTKQLRKLYNDKNASRKGYEDRYRKLSRDRKADIAEKNRVIAEKDRVIEEKDEVITEKTALNQQLRGEKAALCAELETKDLIINELKASTTTLNEKLREKENESLRLRNDINMEGISENKETSTRLDLGKKSHAVTGALVEPIATAARNRVHAPKEDPERLASTSNISLINPGAPTEITVESIHYKIIQEGKPNAGYYRQSNPTFANTGGIIYQVTQILTPLVLQVSGKMIEDVIKINGIKYDRFVDGGNENLVSKPSAHYLVKVEGQFYAKWSTAKRVGLVIDDDS